MMVATRTRNNTSRRTRPEPFYNLPADAVLDRLEVDAGQGLSEQAVEERRQRHGRNQLRESRRRGVWAILLDQFKSVVLIVLAVAGAVSFAFGEWAEGVAILAVLLINGVIGFVSEWRATRSMEALRKMGQARTRVRRAGREQEVGAADLVPGDVVLIEGGEWKPVPPFRMLRAVTTRGDTFPGRLT